MLKRNIPFMQLLSRPSVLCVALLCFTSAAFAQAAPPKPTPDAGFGNWLYKTPDPAVWKKTDKNGALVYSAAEPPGDYCTLTLFAGAKAEADFAEQFNRVVAADQKAKDTVKIEADSGAKASKSAEGFDVLTRNLRSETSALHTFHIYIAGHSGDRFDLAAFQTTSESAWKLYGAQASQFLLSLKAANSLPPAEVDKLLGRAPTETAPPPALPRFDDAPAVASAAATPEVVTPPAAPVVEQPLVPEIPLSKSAIVVKDAVVQKNGQPIDGVKISQHDTEIASPSIAVDHKGVIHVAFVEKHKTTYALAVYHRSSSDGGKTWTEAKNLSEDMPNIQVGLCYALVDAQDRLYIVWRAGIAVYFQVSPNSGGSGENNLVYRVLENGKWSKIKPINTPATSDTQSDGALSYFGTVDGAGHAQVVWNSLPDKWHPEVTTASGTYHQHNAGVGPGLVFQSTLDGTNPSPQREVFISPVTGLDTQGGYGARCDGLDALNGFVDATGSPHFVSAVTRTYDSSLSGKSEYEVVEDGKIVTKIDLPELSYHGWADVPTLLVDAAGKRHVIALYPAGEHPNIRDYKVGSDDEPVIIRQSAGVKGTVEGFSAYQGPNGRMIAVMQVNDSGDRANGETYVSISNGHEWSTPVNVTNNAGRRRFASTRTGVASNVAVSTSYYPGRAAATIDREGHLLLLMINNEYGLFGDFALGVTISSGSSSTPTLQFLRF